MFHILGLPNLHILVARAARLLEGKLRCRAQAQSYADPDGLHMTAFSHTMSQVTFMNFFSVITAFLRVGTGSFFCYVI